MQNDDITLRGLFLPLTTKKIIVFIFLIGFIIFFNSLFNGFVGDDDAQIVKNTNVHSIANLPQFFTGSTFYNGSSKLIGVYYKPFLTSTFALLYGLFGPNPFAFHFIQLMFHIANTSLLFLFLNKFFRKSYSFLLVLIFLVHPINGESVFYASAMQDVLYFFFGILALLILTKYKTKISLIAVFTFLLFSLFSKETGILFVFVSVLYGIFFDRKRFLQILLISLATSAIYIFLRINSIGFLTVATNSQINRLPLMIRLINAPEIILFYLKSFFAPFNFAITYQWAYSKISLVHFIIPLLIDAIIICCITIFALYLYRKKSSKNLHIFIFFFILFGAGLVFHLQIFPLDQTVADRWFYFPLIGLLGMLGVVLESIKLSLKNKWVIFIISVILVILSVRTVVRGFDWKDSFTLYKHDVLVSKDSFSLESVLGLEYMKRGNLQEAKKHIEKSVALYPYFSNLDNLGEVYVGLGDYQKARKAYQKALKYGDYYIVYEDLAGLSLVSGKYEDNVKFIEYALKKFPKDSRLWLYLAIITYQNGDTDIAKNAVNKAYLSDKNNPQIPYVYNSIMNNQPLNLKINKLPQ